jgi:hypothetical protein
MSESWLDWITRRIADEAFKRLVNWALALFVATFGLLVWQLWRTLGAMNTALIVALFVVLWIVSTVLLTKRVSIAMAPRLAAVTPRPLPPLRERAPQRVRVVAARAQTQLLGAVQSHVDFYLTVWNGLDAPIRIRPSGYVSLMIRAIQPVPDCRTTPDPIPSLSLGEIRLRLWLSADITEIVRFQPATHGVFRFSELELLASVVGESDEFLIPVAEICFTRTGDVLWPDTFR